MTAPVETPPEAVAPAAPPASAAADTHTGGMLALVPANPEQYVVTGGDPAEELHVTLAYLGDDVTDLPEEVVAALQGVAASAASTYATITARISGYGVWNPDGGEDGTKEPCAVYELEGSGGYGLADLQDYISWKTREAMGEALYPEQHRPWKAHMTAGWSIGTDGMTAVGEVEYTAIRLALGSETFDFPLTGMGDLYPYDDCYTAKSTLTAAGAVVVPEGAPTEGEDAPPLPNLTADDGVPVTFPVMIVEGLETDDGRFIVPGALTHRALPLSILAQIQNPDGGDGHDGAYVVGRIDTLTRVPGPSVISKETGEPFPEGTFIWSATGFMDPEAAGTQLARKRYLTGNSADLVALDAEFIFDDDADMMDPPSQIRITKGKIAATTLVPIPAFADGYVVLDGEELTPADDMPEAIAASAAWTSGDIGDDCRPCAAGLNTATAVTAAASVKQMFPPASAFADPGFSEYTPLKLVDDAASGFTEVYGHLGSWEICHTGYNNQCLLMPHSPSDYAYFNVGLVRVQDGDQVREVSAGHITMGEGGHAGMGLSAADAAAFYDNVNTVVADITAGEDKFGIWVHGTVRRTATHEQVEALRASPLSGDWRSINGGPLELVAALAVNTGGFPVPRARVASGAPYALTAAGAVRLSEAVGAVNAVHDAVPEGGELAEHVADLVLGKLRAEREEEAAQLALRGRMARARIRIP